MHSTGRWFMFSCLIIESIKDETIFFSPLDSCLSLCLIPLLSKCRRTSTTTAVVNFAPIPTSTYVFFCVGWPTSFYYSINVCLTSIFFCYCRCCSSCCLLVATKASISTIFAWCSHFFSSLHSFHLLHSLAW